MKYIRTKDGRISYLSSEPNEEITNYEIITSKGTLTYRREDEVIKIADSIEELCDELVFEWHRSSISHDNDIWHLYHEMSLKEEVENALNDGFRASKEEVKNIYGAIWTKGKHNEPILKPVARLNKKGELELL